MELSYNEFVYFCMLYAAGLDAVIEQGELDYIASHSEADHPKMVSDRYYEMNDAAHIEFMREHREYYDTEEARNKLFEEIEGLFKSDGKYAQIEHMAMNMLKRILV